MQREAEVRAGKAVGSGLSTTFTPMSDDWFTPIFVSVCLVSVIALGSGMTWLQATQEAAAFNRLTTGPKVTVWDAVWLDLRVEAR